MNPELTDRYTRLYKSSIYYLLLLLLGLIIAFWPISFYVFSLKNDALTYFLPVRTLVSESYHHGIVPLWSPYIYLGYPLHGDMQSGVWNPIVQLFSLLGPYQLYTLQLETLLYIYISGAGMFFLLKHLKIHPTANLLSSFAIMLCGFNSDSSQFLNWVAGLAFLPLVFLFYYRCLRELSVQTALFTGTFLYLLFSTAYPADFIICVYLMLAMFIWQYARAIVDKDVRRRLQKSLTLHLLIGVVFIVLGLPAILSYMEALPHMERGSGTSYSDVMSNPLHPFLISSFANPLSIWKMPGVEITDNLQRNMYIGIIPFILVLCGFLTRSHDAITRFVKYAIIIFLLFSLGPFGGVRAVAYYTLPLMDTFRHPANARLFTIFFCCLLAAFTLNDIIRQGIVQQKVKNSIAIVTALLAIVLAWSFFTPSEPFTSFPGDMTLAGKLKYLMDSSSFLHVTLMAVIIQLPFLVCSWMWLRNKITYKQLAAISIANCILFAMLFQPVTVVKNDSAANVQQMIDTHSVPGFPLPDLTSSIADNSADGMKYFQQIGTLNLYNKKVGRVDFKLSPTTILSQKTFWFSSNIRDIITKYPLLYKADSAVIIHDSLHAAMFENKRIVFVDRQSLADSINHLPKNNTVDMHAESFRPNRFVFSVQSSDSAYLVLTQNHFPFWQVQIDGVAQSPDKVNLTFMGFLIPPGEHTVEFVYLGTNIIVAWWISTCLLAMLTVYGLLFSVRSKKRNAGK